MPPIPVWAGGWLGAGRREGGRMGRARVAASPPSGWVPGGGRVGGRLQAALRRSQQLTCVRPVCV